MRDRFRCRHWTKRPETNRVYCHGGRLFTGSGVFTGTNHSPRNPADIAADKGVPLDSLQKAMMKVIQQRLQKQLDDGQITQMQHDQMLSRAAANLARFIDGEGERRARSRTCSRRSHFVQARLERGPPHGGGRTRQGMQ